MSQSEREKHILNSVQNAMDDFGHKNINVGHGSVRLYIDKAQTPDMDTEIFVDADYRHLPLRDYNAMLDTLHHVVRDYDKIGHRNHKKDGNHLCKHAMHLIRLMLTAIDILEKQTIITYRKDDLPLLMSIRNGEYLLDDGTMSPEFYEILGIYEKRFQEAAKKTTLPDEPDMAKVGSFVEHIYYPSTME